VAPQTKTVTEILTARRDGAMTRAQMLDAMRTYPWQAVESSNPDPGYFSEVAWEHMDYPQVGTAQEVTAAEIRRIINREDRDAILDIIRSLSR
jgi:hypothetical protein